MEVNIQVQIEPARIAVATREFGLMRFELKDARSLYEQLGAVLGALDAETHPKNPEKA